MNQATTGAIAPEPFVFAAMDGMPLAGTLYAGNGPPVLLGSALAVPQRFYAPFAQWLAAQGHCVMTFDVRGIGASLPVGGHVRHVQADMMTWAQQDFAAAVQALCERSGQRQIKLIGHSLGAHHPAMCLPDTQARIALLVSVAAGSGYWRDWAAPSRRLAPLMLHVAAPILTPLFGYFPGKRLGMVGNLPAGVMRQWSAWCRHPQFAWGQQAALIAPLMQAARFPVHALSFSDDEAMSRTATEKLLAALPQAPSRLTAVTPAQMGVARIGHLGAFRQEMHAQLWPFMAKALKD